MSMSRLDLNLLVVLDTVLSERSVARAARRLHVTPSAISNALARLRAALGDPLVTRVGRGIVPTPRPLALAPALQRALLDLELAVAEDVFDPATTTKQFTVAIADAGQIARLPGIVQLVAAEMPRARLRVVGIDTYFSSGGLAGTDIDVGLIGVADKPPGVHLLPLYEEESVLVAGAVTAACKGALPASGSRACSTSTCRSRPGAATASSLVATRASASYARSPS